MSRGVTRNSTAGRHGKYEIRSYDPGDCERFRVLYRDVWGWLPCREWFEWRYGSPHGGDVEMMVAEHDGRLVGALPFIPYRLRSNAGTSLALQPADAMVHPDHRRQGLLTRMAEDAIERYRTGRPTCFFNFPNDQILQAFLNLGWHEVGRVTTYYRIQNPSALVDSLPGEALVGRLAKAFVDGYHHFYDGQTTATDLSVERHTSVPAGVLAGLYRRAVPNRVHVERDETYYRWRFGNPNWECQTYVASRDEPTAALVVCRLERDGTTYGRLMEAAPLSGPSPEAAAALLDAVVSDYADADVLAVTEDTLPDPVLARHGFRRDDRPPLSLAATQTPLVVRPLDGGRLTNWTADPTERSNWLATFGEQDGIC